jgi:hypothetical protein
LPLKRWHVSTIAKNTKTNITGGAHLQRAFKRGGNPINTATIKMSYEKVKSIKIKDGKVFVTSKCNNDTEPIKQWECTTISTILIEQGQEAAEAEILKAYESGDFQSTSDNKYTRALRVLRSMPEYEAFNWRVNDCPEYDENGKFTPSPVTLARRSHEFIKLLKRALNTKLEKSRVIVSMKNWDGRTIYIHKKLKNSVRFSFNKSEAKVFDYAEDAKRLSTCFDNGKKWNIETI